MGCQQFCQNKEDEKFILAPGGKDRDMHRAKSGVNSRNQNQEQTLNSNMKSISDSIRGTINQNETIVMNESVKLALKANNIHRIIPVWIEKGSLVHFSVSGEWGFHENPELFDCIGCPYFEEKPHNLNFGSLVGYIPGDNYFAVCNNTKYLAKKDGPLYLFQNVGLYSVNPRGTLDIIIKGVIPASRRDIEYKLGWDLNIIDTSIPEMNENEVELLILINKVRSNPKLFAQQHIIKTGQSIEDELEETLMAMEPLSCLQCFKSLYETSRNHAIDLGENKIAGHISSNGLTMEQRLHHSGIFTKVFAENCIFGYNDPLEIAMRLLFDEDNESRNQRKIILSRDFNFIGITIQPHSGEFCWSCIQDFILDS